MLSAMLNFWPREIWEDKSHDKMTWAYSKSSGYEKFSVHTNRKKLFHSRERIKKVPFSRIFLCGYVRCSVDGRPNRKNKVAFSNLSGIVWTRPLLKKKKRLDRASISSLKPRNLRRPSWWNYFAVRLQFVEVSIKHGWLGFLLSVCLFVLDS